MVGTQVGSYKILEKLGEGGMGVVYKAVDTSLDRVVALKSLSTELAKNPELEQRFRAEARAQANLNHTNIAMLYAFLVQEGTAWMVMEYIEGESVDQMMHRRGLLPPEIAVPIFKQALLGIGYAHRQGIVHRDIKPSNIMVSKGGIVKVMDFGIAKMMGNRGMTRTGTQMGTAYYMSPEQVLNKAVDFRSDIYSLGVTLYEMLTAHVPFSGDSDYQIMSSHLNEPPTLPTKFYPYIPKGIEAAVLRAIEKNPDARFQTVEEFSAALDQPDVVPAGFSPGVAAAVDPTVAERPFGATRPPVQGQTGFGQAPAGVGTNFSVMQQQRKNPPFWVPLLATRQRKMIAGGCGAAVLLLAGWLTFRHPTPDPTLGVINPPPSPGPVVPKPAPPAPEPQVDPDPTPTPAPVVTGNPPAPKPGPKPGPGPKKEPKPKTEEEPKPVVARAVIPAGTIVAVRTIDRIDAMTHSKGETFAASLDAPIVAGGKVIAPKGANVRLRLVTVAKPTKFTGHSEVVLELASIGVGGRQVPVHSDYFTKQAAGRGGRTAGVVGGMAAAGAGIGALLHKKNRGAGAGEGAAAGAAGGVGVQAATHGESAVVPPETKIKFTLEQPVSTSGA